MMKYILNFQKWYAQLNEGFMLNLINISKGYMTPNGITSFNIGKDRYGYSVDNAALTIFKNKLRKKFGHRSALNYIEQQANMAWKLMNGNWYKMKRNGKTWNVTNNIDPNPPDDLRPIIKKR